jgi:hypothetical protein
MIFRFIIALLVAGWYRCRRGGDCLKTAKESFVAVKNRPDGGHLMEEARNSECEKCPLFYKPLRTCGSPLLKTPESRDHNGKPMGCFCFMPLKSKTECNCWLYGESGGVMGWPEPLNDFPPEKQ